MSGLPGFLPGVLFSIAIGLAASGAVGRSIGTGRALAWMLLVAAGIILSATLTPGLPDAAEDVAHRTCDFSRVGLAPLRLLLSLNDTSGNVLLFVPLGAVIGLLPRSRFKRAIIVAAIGLPVLIEAAQLLVPLLHRACESSDVVNNLAGLVIGFAAGALARLVVGIRTGSIA